MRINTEELIIKYKDDLFRVAFHICQNKEDSDDAVQETFIQYHMFSGISDLSDKTFDSFF